MMNKIKLSLLLALVSISCAAQQQNIKISALPSASGPLNGAELLPIVKSGATVKVTARAIATLALDTADSRYIKKSAPDSTIQRISAVNTNAGLGQATSQIQIGTTGLIVDSGLHFSRGAALVIAQNESATGQNPMWLTMHGNSGTANGMLFFGFGGNGKLYPKMLFKSNYAEANASDLGLALVTQVAEVPGYSDISGMDFATLSFYSATPSTYTAGQNAFYAGGARVALSQPGSWVFRFKNLNNLAFGVRASGDVHPTGTLYAPISIVSGNFTPSLSVQVYKFIGSTATCTLPSAVGDNTGRTITILNFGTGVLTLSGYYVDGTTLFTTLAPDFPNNVLHLISDGSNWIAK